MANPAIVTCTKDTWVKVATNVTAGQLHILSGAPSQYLHTYRVTGGDAPTTLAEAVVISQVSLPISAAAAIDVYIYASGAAGSVRVDV
jgi:hypothetical protein